MSEVYTSLHGDEYYTLYEHAIAVCKNLNLEKGTKIWLPFNDKGRNFEKACIDCGYIPICTETDFFETDPPEGCKHVVSNPPFSRKKEILKRCMEMKIKYALLMPVLFLASGVMFDYGNQMIFWRRRVRFELPDGSLGWPRCSALAFSNGLFKQDLTIIQDMNKQSDYKTLKGQMNIFDFI